jgi:hypothetical protein
LEYDGTNDINNLVHLTQSQHDRFTDWWAGGMDQDKPPESLFESILTLKTAIGEKNVLQIIHPGKIWIASLTLLQKGVDKTGKTLI